MGVDVSQAVALGFEISEDQLKKILGVHHPEVFREEPRFDSKTGQPTTPKRVVERKAYWTYEVDGQSYVSIGILSEAVAHKLGCDVTHNGCYLTGHHNFIFGVATDLGCGDAGRCPEDSRIPFQTILERALRLETIANGLRELGFEPGEALLVNTWSIS